MLTTKWGREPLLILTKMTAVQVLRVTAVRRLYNILDSEDEDDHKGGQAQGNGGSVNVQNLWMKQNQLKNNNPN